MDDTGVVMEIYWFKAKFPNRLHYYMYDDVRDHGIVEISIDTPERYLYAFNLEH